MDARGAEGTEGRTLERREEAFLAFLLASLLSLLMASAIALLAWLIDCRMELRVVGFDFGLADDIDIELAGVLQV